MKTTVARVFDSTLDSSKCVTFLLATLGLVACGGSGPAGSGAPVNDFASAPLSPETSVSGVCGFIDGLDSCPEGMICIGDVFDTTVANIVPLSRGRRPDWSLDGQRIVFHRKLSAIIDHGEVIVINSDGSGETVLAAGVEPAWSTDGRHIAYTSAEGIAVMNADGTGTSTIVRHGTGSLNRVGSPAWSPDGKRIAFVDRGDRDNFSSRIYIVNIDGSDVRRLNQTSENTERDPAWSPDGGRIAFTYDRDLTRLGTINAAGGPITAIASSQFAKSKPDWSPSGLRVAFSQSRCGVDQIRITNLVPGGWAQLIAGAREPAWSPDGARLAFASGAPNFPPLPSDLTGATSVYDRETVDSFRFDSRYVFYEKHGRFQLQYQHPTAGLLVYSGSYTRDGTAFIFEFDGWSTAGPWSAAGELDGSRLSVKYNIVMMLTDFEDGVYVLRETGQ